MEKEGPLNSFLHSNFNYCPFVWHFCSKKIEKIQERILRLLHNGFASDYNELLKKSEKAVMEIKHLTCLTLEIFKTVNDLNLYYMKEIFSKRTNLTQRSLDVKINQNHNMKMIAFRV